MDNYEELGYNGFSYLIRDKRTGKKLEFATYLEAMIFMAAQDKEPINIEILDEYL